jgi:hypothetical protein
MFAGTPIFIVDLNVESCSAVADTRLRHAFIVPSNAGKSTLWDYYRPLPVESRYCNVLVCLCLFSDVGRLKHCSSVHAMIQGYECQADDSVFRKCLEVPQIYTVYCAFQREDLEISSLMQFNICSLSLIQEKVWSVVQWCWFTITTHARLVQT